ncbi:kinesin motor domain protein [Ichthyophthirius multifiliis]|uniref:Kinesin motor domain protein n=1 Tax=Ichthyophthirius multifiliis TaxID=5932 RepID=G0R6J1_ICHMU|nr:kinesin motor domain protein [Ichthyophthirius multifiliis]EGR26914.1 kinesin motor domain protein [Ichthyophthirius multifiliis]|eukprot:XP_004023798.1 kinesin motor domain protein [Ichthyophthirius multifiliis]
MENIKVAVRIRPLNEQEKINKEEPIFEVQNDNCISLNKQYIKELINQKKMNLMTNISYKFDKCFNQNSSNQNIFNELVNQVTQSVIKGINSTVFMYGQTGSGKTYTTLDQILSIIQQVFFIQKKKKILKKKNKQYTFGIKCSYFEIYNENIYDLLKVKNQLEESLCISENLNKKDFIIKNLKEFPIQYLEDVLDIIYQGEENRHYAETILNHTSSRSHTIFKLSLVSYSNNKIVQYLQNNNNINNVNNQHLLELVENNNTIITEMHKQKIFFKQKQQKIEQKKVNLLIKVYSFQLK